MTSFPFFSILTLIFVVLKLTNFISWSWWLVILPIFTPLIILSVVFVVAAITIMVKGEE